MAFGTQHVEATGSQHLLLGFGNFGADALDSLLLLFLEILLTLVLLLELLLERLNIALKCLLLELVIGLQCKDLVVGLFGQTSG